MPMPLVETKLYVPPPRPGLVRRARLDALLDGPPTRLTLVSAPAGFGKTTLLTSWLHRPSETPDERRRVAWVCLDASDRAAASFWTYVLTALDRAAPGTGTAGLALLDAGQPVESVLTAVLNELSVQPDELTLVLDDYHLAEGPAIQPGMALLVERLPPQARLVISTRADPVLPLARLRARGELTEVRVADLRFTGPEVSQFLTGLTGLELGAADVAALGAKTEGWVASLQLAGLSLRQRDDPSSFIAGFAGDDRHVVDYLVDEVLDREPAPVLDFLLGTSVLDQLCGPLCDAVTGGTGGSRVLVSLERRNLFLVPLDDHRRWYRYHHLFADVLRAHLLQREPESVPELHRRASRWLAAEGRTEDAVRHALAAGDAVTAAELVEGALPGLRRERREDVLQRWAHELPDEVVRDRPVLAVGLVGGMMAGNDVVGAGQRLDAVERMLARPAGELRVVDPAELPRLPGALATFRAALALAGGDVREALAQAERAQRLAADGDDLTRAAAAGLTGLATWNAGDLATAHAAYRVTADGLTRAGHIADVLGCSLTIADMELELGRLADATRTLEDALALARGNPPHEGAGPRVLRGTPDMLVGLSRAAWHRNDLAAAADHVHRAQELGEAAGLPQHPYRWRVALARVRAAGRDHAAALDLLDEAERVYVADYSPQVHPIHATRARVQLAAGDLAAAREWGRRHGVRTDDDPSYLSEYEHLTLARVLLASGSAVERADALSLLDRLLEGAEDGGRYGSVIEIELLRAVGRHLAGSPSSAMTALERAVELGEPDGWIRVFVDAGRPLDGPLRTLASRRPSSGYLRDLVAAREADHSGSGTATSAGHDRDSAGSLVDPLSEREVEVLRLLASELDGPGIARELVVSLNTVRTHTKHIYTKLGVNSRREAVSRAHRLGLLSRS
jgi:LuxR family maltose regulon positive regulatory protein